VMVVVVMMILLRRLLVGRVKAMSVLSRGVSLLMSMLLVMKWLDVVLGVLLFALEVFCETGHFSPRRRV